MSPTDDEIRAMLAARAGRAAEAGTEAQALIAAAREGALAESRPVQRRFRVTGPIPRIAAGAASLSAIMLVVVLVGLPLANRPPASAVPSVVPSSMNAPSAPATLVPPDTGYYPGGVPRSIDGEPVLIGLDTQQRLAQATDDTPFLAGGFTWFGPAICSGGIGPSDPNPLGARGCAPFNIEGIPGELHVPTGRIEVGDVPLVVRVHTQDSAAETCWPENVERCRARVVLEAVVWQGDDETAAAPIGPREAVGRILAMWIADRREQADGSIAYVDEPRFVIPINCPDPFPTLVYAARGDPRLGLLAVFRDEESRAMFQASIAPSEGASCLESAIDRGERPRWIGTDNILVLAFANDPTAAEIAAQVAWVEGVQRGTIPLPLAAIDRSRETLLDYLDSRAAGPNKLGDAAALTFGPEPTHPDGNPSIDVFAGWSQDVLRRYEADALNGVVELVTDAPTRDQLGDAAPIVESSGGERVWLYHVRYPRATNPLLAAETFAIVQIPDSTFRDWAIVRVAGEPFPIVPLPIPTPRSEHAFPSGLVEPILPPGDVPCVPEGQECP